MSKHQDGGMYKTPYPGYPFLMLPDPYLPNSSVSPSVSPLASVLILLLAIVHWGAVCLLMVSCVSSWGQSEGPHLPLFTSHFGLQCKFVHLSYHLDSLVSSPNTEHMVLCFRGSFIWTLIIFSAGGDALAIVAHHSWRNEEKDGNIHSEIVWSLASIIFLVFLAEGNRS